ncbi:uncharacterized protein LOC114934493 [Nylanderia fulva]|uniref:uncharacterized protein LOC114934493 n=1 Tax=Nylanderia fulva TaxID=613905 RepID=UPI0010FB8D28|nr:uncharacterized protein LOC114934493 [Nylanderia fulva]
MEERACETHFMKNVSANEQGRYIVRLLVREDVLCQIGDLRDIALKCFHNLERRLQREPAFRVSYIEFLREYERLRHVRQTSSHDCEEEVAIYLLHYGVIKGEGRDAKLRVVFDASCKSSTGISLNDVLMIRPTIQQDLVSILLRFRTFAYAFTADVEKMY